LKLWFSNFQKSEENFSKNGKVAEIVDFFWFLYLKFILEYQVASAVPVKIESATG